MNKYGIRITAISWACENGGDDVTGTREEMEAKAAEYTASLFPGQLVWYEAALYADSDVCSDPLCACNNSNPTGYCGRKKAR